MLGTSGVVFAALPAFAADPQARVHAFCHAVPGTWHAMGVMLSAAGSLQWFRDRLAPATAFGELVAEADAVGRRAPRACSSSPTSPASGRRTPTRARGRRSSASSFATTAAPSCARCWKASRSGCATRSSCCAASASTAERARVSGGGARGGLWLSILASVLGLPLETTAAEEGSAYGAALLGGVAGGVFADVHEAVARCVRVDCDDRARRCLVIAPTRSIYARYRALYPALEPLEER